MRSSLSNSFKSFIAAGQGLLGDCGPSLGARLPTPLHEDIAHSARGCQLPPLGSCSLGLPTPWRTTGTDDG
jgi:hypothetical protein